MTPKEFDRVLNKGKQFKWEGNSFLQVWMDGWIGVGNASPKNSVGACMTHLCGIGPFWDSINLQLFLGTILVVRDPIINLVICFLMCGV